MEISYTCKHCHCSVKTNIKPKILTDPECIKERNRIKKLKESYFKEEDIRYGEAEKKAQEVYNSYRKYYGWFYRLLYGDFDEYMRVRHHFVTPYAMYRPMNDEFCKIGEKYFVCSICSKRNYISYRWY